MTKIPLKRPRRQIWENFRKACNEEPNMPQLFIADGDISVDFETEASIGADDSALLNLIRASLARSTNREGGLESRHIAAHIPQWMRDNWSPEDVAMIFSALSLQVNDET